MSDACGVMNWKSSREFWKLSTVAVFIAGIGGILSQK